MTVPAAYYTKSISIRMKDSLRIPSQRYWLSLTVDWLGVVGRIVMQVSDAVRTVIAGTVLNYPPATFQSRAWRLPDHRIVPARSVTMSPLTGIIRHAGTKDANPAWVLSPKPRRPAPCLTPPSPRWRSGSSTASPTSGNTAPGLGGNLTAQAVAFIGPDAVLNMEHADCAIGMQPP